LLTPFRIGGSVLFPGKHIPPYQATRKRQETDAVIVGSESHSGMKEQKQLTGSSRAARPVTWH